MEERMNFGKLKTRLIQAVVLAVATLSLRELLLMMPHSTLDVLICFVTTGLLAAQVFWRQNDDGTPLLQLFHGIAAVNVCASMFMLFTKEMVHLEDFQGHSVVFPLTAYLLWFSRLMTT
ncbi:MAG: hypothetical protein MRY81_12235, partial [Donghicola eburneus]|nr:hypothetical protein [Donghicola eburneus]